jgi:ribulose-5-phosphate 4-epimerase/fuculose-1-phosphate aldolase
VSNPTIVPAADPALIDELVLANQILYHHKIVDAFGHITVRHDKDPQKYLMSRHLAPGLVSRDDIVTFDLDSNPVANPAPRYYSERFIHGEIYKRRSDVHSIVHCHTPQLLPYAATRTELKPLFHISAFLGGGVAMFEIRDTGGMTDMLVRTAPLGQALAQSLGDRPIVLMRGHGATIVGKSIKQVVHRSIYAVENAKLQMDAIRLGEPVYLAPEEAALAGAAADETLFRPWALWEREIRDKD